MRKTFGIFLLLAVAGGAFGQNFTISIPESWGTRPGILAPTTLAVTGTVKVQAVPDRIVVAANIYTENKKAGVAFEENQLKMGQLMDALLALGVPKKNIATTSLSVSPIYGKSYGKPEKYAVTRSLAISQDDMDKISPVLDAMIDAGVADIGSIQFVVKDLDAKYREALEGAAADCRVTADRLAAAMGARVTGLQSLSYNYGGGPMDYRALERTAGTRYDSSSTMAENQMIVPAEFSGAVNVNAVFTIEYSGK